MGSLIVISAPSGAGKTTLCQRLIEDYPKDLVLSISSTTRAPRGSEKNGVNYFFISKEDFEKKIKDHLFAEWATVHDHYYGTSKAVIDQALQVGKSILLDIDVQGATSLAKSYPKETLRIFIQPPNLRELENRLRSRGTDSEATIQKRLKNAEREMNQAFDFDHVITNDDLDRAYRELKKIVEHRIYGKNA